MKTILEQLDEQLCLFGCMLRDLITASGRWRYYSCRLMSRQMHCLMSEQVRTTTCN